MSPDQCKMQQWNIKGTSRVWWSIKSLWSVHPERRPGEGSGKPFSLHAGFIYSVISWAIEEIFYPEKIYQIEIIADWVLKNCSCVRDRFWAFSSCFILFCHRGKYLAVCLSIHLTERIIWVVARMHLMENTIGAETNLDKISQFYVRLLVWSHGKQLEIGLLISN